MRHHLLRCAARRDRARFLKHQRLRNLPPVLYMSTVISSLFIYYEIFVISMQWYYVQKKSMQWYYVQKKHAVVPLGN